VAALDDICQALAANLAALKQAELAPRQPLVTQVSSFYRDKPSPPSVMVLGVDEIEYDTAFQRGGDSWTILIEAVLGAVSEIGAQGILRRLLASEGETSLKAAVESDRRLTKRYNDDTGLITTGQPAACDDLRVTNYRGQRLVALGDGSRTISAVWAVQVET
jgi:hypothetical protein